jgi:serine/threonine protein kinase
MGEGGGGTARLDDLAEEFLARHRAGEAPTAEEYAAAHPHLARKIREVFPTLLMVAGLTPGVDLGDVFVEEEAPSSRRGDPLGRYTVIRRLGRGGMGEVFEAWAPDGTRVAIKRIHDRFAGDPEFVARFLREAEVGRRIRHPNVVRTLEVGAAPHASGEGIPYLVLEYVEGHSLKEAAKAHEGGRLPEEEVRRVATALAGALGAFHALGVVHRDLKPANVFLTPEGRVVLMDLGVARATKKGRSITLSGEFVGSLAYAAPEQFSPEPADLGPWTDLYSLGLTLHEVATGCHPFVSQVMEDASEAEAHLSPFLRAVLGRLREKDPARRFRSAEDLLAVLGEGDGGEWWRARRAR